jgi:hypothetical protein
MPGTKVVNLIVFRNVRDKKMPKRLLSIQFLVKYQDIVIDAPIRRVIRFVYEIFPKNGSFISLFRNECSEGFIVCIMISSRSIEVLIVHENIIR